MAVFEVYKTDDEGVAWTIIKNDIEGTYPCGGEDSAGRIWCFYVHNSDTLRYVYSDDQGVSWSSAADIMASIDEAQLGWRETETGRIIVSYWKDDKAYIIYTDDRGGNWGTPVEVV